MKRLVAALLAAMVMVLGVATANATVRWVVDPLPIRVSSATVQHGFSDSTSRSWPATAARADTTAPVLIADLLPNPFTTTAAGVDTALAYALYSLADPAVTTTSDSMYITAQVSMDGNTWTIATSTHNSQTSPVSSGIASSLVLEASSSNCYVLTFDYAMRSAATATDFTLTGEGTAPTMNQTFGWKYVRFIIAADNETSYRQTYIGHWADVVPGQGGFH